jgi:hypothetical protein
MSQRKSIAQPAARNHPGVGYAHPHAVAAKNIAGQIDQTNVHADLGKPPLPKRAFTETPEIHSGMMGKSKTGTHFAGLSGQDLSRYDADGPDPLSAPPRGKKLAPLAPHPSMRDRFDDALSSGSPGAAHSKAMQSRDQFTKGQVDMADKVLSEAASAKGSDIFDKLALGKLPAAVSEKE